MKMRQMTMKIQLMVMQRSENNAADDNTIAGDNTDGSTEDTMDENKNTDRNDDTISGEIGNSVKDLGDGVGNAVKDMGDAVDNAAEGR